MTGQSLFIITFITLVFALVAFLYAWGEADKWRNRHDKLWDDVQDDLLSSAKDRQLVIAIMKHIGKPITLTDEFVIGIVQESAVMIDRNELTRQTTYTYVQNRNLYLEKEQKGQE